MLPPPEGLTEDDFEGIEAAVMETERGRWFLQEFTRRIRAAETAEVLAAVERLSARDRDECIARRDAAEATAAMVEAMLKLSRFALGAVAGEDANPLPSPPTRLCEGANEWEGRLAALKELDALDVEAKVKLFG